MTDSDRFKRLEALFHELDALPPEQRQARLTKLAAEDPALHAELIQLIDPSPTRAEDAQALDSVADRGGLSASLGGAMTDPECVGPYRLIRSIGEGGMGRVYLAEQSEPVKRRVALKLTRRGLDSREALARFNAERQALAVLEHPNIARVLDAGSLDDGRPWFAMEYIDGVPITQWASERKLGLVERIELLLPVCAAVQHAHRKGLIHRDLKPSNILVLAHAERGLPKVIDFGIARLLEEDADEQTQVTRLGELIGTPEYMSPEQAALGEIDIDTRSDVYSLGLVLYELLVGTLPITGKELRALGFEAMCRQIREGETPQPSRLQSKPETIGDATTQRWRSRLKGDLDSVLLKALAKDRERRYGSADDLAEDLRRYLNNEPVLAQPPSLAYRVRKFVRRHRWPVAAAAIVSVALVSSAVVASYGLLQAREQRDIAIYQQQRIQANSEFFSLLLEETGGGAMTSVELLDRGRELLERQFDSGQPFMASVLLDVSKRYASLGEQQRSRELLAESEQLARRFSDNDVLAAVLCRSARLDRARDPEAATARLNEALEIYDRLNSPGIETTVECARTKSRSEDQAGNSEAALQKLLDAKKSLDAHPAPGTNLRGLILNDIAFHHYRNGDLNASADLLEEVLELLETTGRGSTLGYQRVAANRAVTLQTLGRTPEALEAFEDLVVRMRASGFKGRGAATLLTQYGGLLLSAGRPDTAADIFREGLALAEASGDARTSAHLHMEFAKLQLADDDFDQALASLESANSYLENNEQADLQLARNLRVLRARTLRRAGDLGAARELIDALLDEVGFPDAGETPGMISALIEAADIYLVSRDFDRAETLADGLIERLSEHERPAGTSSVHLGRALVQRGQIRLESGQAETARSDFEAALPHLENALGEDHKETQAARRLLARSAESGAGPLQVVPAG
ncbi:MAG: protein kinase [Wenzhouxiangella sp.]|jgi:non-specific serine/threonine protein kinase/serine/threonine-protein kinase|nr:protein kinase [Wenzhouxiangella sp.]